MPEYVDPSSSQAGHAEAWFNDLRLAAGFLTRVVPPQKGAAGARPLAQAARAFPLVGVGLGLGAGAVFAIAAVIGLTPPLAAVCALAALVAATGALHEDGLGDVADGFGGGGDRARKLDIMRDSRTGAYGVIAIALAVVARVAAIAALAEPGLVVAALVAAGATSRAALPAVMLQLPPARDDGLGAGAGIPRRNDVYVGLAIAGVVAIVALGFVDAVVALICGAGGALAVAALAKRQIGGHTGDVLGAVQQTVEIAMLFAAVTLR